MLYDKRWETKELPPTEPEPATWRQILLRAAEMIEEVGWCQGQFVKFQKDAVIGYYAIGYCAVGAINRANGSSGGEARYQAEYYLMQRIGCGVEYWNDATGQTKQQVVAKLREVAAG